MWKGIIFIFAILTAASSAERRHMIMHRFYQQVGPGTLVFSDGECVNILQENFHSGRAGGDYKCTVFLNRNCEASVGPSLVVDSRGTNFWDTGSGSMRC
jgi:hypothetical protein